MATEKRLIDANELKAIFDKRYDDAYMQSHTRPNRAYWEAYSIGVNWGRNTISDVKTVDAVEVVRCKNCKHGIWDEENEMWKCVYSATFDDDIGEWFGFYDYNQADHFCSYGAKMDGDGNG